jgi:hypothetical protein
MRLTKKNKDEIINEFKVTGISREGFMVYVNNENGVKNYHVIRVPVTHAKTNVKPENEVKSKASSASIKAIFDG